MTKPKTAQDLIAEARHESIDWLNQEAEKHGIDIECHNVLVSEDWDDMPVAGWDAARDGDLSAFHDAVYGCISGGVWVWQVHGSTGLDIDGSQRYVVAEGNSITFYEDYPCADADGWERVRSLMDAARYELRINGDLRDEGGE